MKPNVWLLYWIIIYFIFNIISPKIFVFFDACHLTSELIVTSMLNRNIESISPFKFSVKFHPKNKSCVKWVIQHPCCSQWVNSLKERAFLALDYMNYLLFFVTYSHVWWNWFHQIFTCQVISMVIKKTCHQPWMDHFQQQFPLLNTK